MRFYRIKQIAADKFIPQVKVGFIGFWEGIDATHKEIWYSEEYMRAHCSVDTLEKAKEIIEEYKGKINEQEKYPKYHKL